MSRLTEGIAFVTVCLSQRFGSSRYLGSEVGLHGWRVEQGRGGAAFDAYFTHGVLTSTHALLDTSIREIAEIVESSTSLHPGYFHVSLDGVQLRGMHEFKFEADGQNVRCYVVQRPQPVWHVEVDGVARGPFLTASPADARDVIAEKASIYLTRLGAFDAA